MGKKNEIQSLRVNCKRPIVNPDHWSDDWRPYGIDWMKFEVEGSKLHKRKIKLRGKIKTRTKMQNP